MFTHVCRFRVENFFAASRHTLGILALLALGPGATSYSQAVPGMAGPRADFEPAIELAPFVVKGQRLSISILARTKADRRYAEQFAESVIEVASVALEKSPGAGLVIVGEEGEPHPVFVFRRFIELAEAGQLEPGVAARASEATATLRDWQERLNLGEAIKQGLPFDTFVKALPLPLAGIGSHLYQLAWTEGFDEARVTEKLRQLTAGFEGRQAGAF